MLQHCITSSGPYLCAQRLPQHSFTPDRHSAPSERRYWNSSDAATSTFPPAASRSAIACSLVAPKPTNIPILSSECPRCAGGDAAAGPPSGPPLPTPAPAGAGARERAVPTGPRRRPRAQTRSQRRRGEPRPHPPLQGSVHCPEARAPRDDISRPWIRSTFSSRLVRLQYAQPEL